MNNLNLPEAFVSRMKTLLGSHYSAFQQSLDTPAPVSIRLNPLKPIPKFEEEERVPWCKTGRYLTERPSFTFDPLFHAGTYYVQEASSMLIEQAWQKINPGNKTVRVLDLCAAPGGKSTHLLSLMNNQSLLVSNEIIPNRNRILQENIIKWGYGNCIITQNKPEDFAPFQNYFDIILTDAPCSGEGLFRKDKDAVTEWSEANVAMCAARQKNILQYAATCLKPGGFLIYSTCTYEPDENDGNVAALLQSGFTIIDLGLTEKFPGIEKIIHGFQCYPHKVEGEGFFISVLQKDGGGFEPNYGFSNSWKLRGDEPSAHYLEDAAGFKPYVKNDRHFALPPQVAEALPVLERSLYIRNAGLLLGEYKGKDFLPSADLALSINLKKGLPSVELNYEQAIAYLRGETPPLSNAAIGWRLAKFEGHYLGWMKLIPGRWNNHYPKEWRILKR
ncbi:MAG TPA: hypothetical protein VG603_06540 [Chitinophagales bacterium]|nr:hypothetical protein [Chitinophagales bacterium]